MADRSLTLQERSTSLSLVDREGSGAPRFMQKEFTFSVEFWLFEDSSFIVWNNADVSLSPRSLDLTVKEG